MTAPAGRPRNLALALSGGGHRATLFCLGALLRVVDQGAHAWTASISSVSGGSLTNAFAGWSADFRSTDSKRFRSDVAEPLAKQIALEGTLFRPWTTKLYLAVLGGLAVATVVLPWMLDAAFLAKVAVALVLLIVLGWWFGLRGRVCALAFEKTLFSSGGRPLKFPDLHAGVMHVICATELRTAQRVYFGRDFVYGWWFGHGESADVTLARAVQASAAFPGGFPPARLSTRAIRFRGGKGPKHSQPGSLVMSDGGVYDNMGDEWATGFQNRTEAWPWLGNHAALPDQLVVVNASARSSWTAFRRGRVPWLGEVAALLRVNDVMYVNTTNVRRQNIVRSFDPEHPDRADKLPGALIQIARSPFHVADAYIDCTNGAVSQRAHQVIAALGGDEARPEWTRIARENSAVATTLSKLGKEVSARLLYHAYVLTMCNLYVVFGPERGWTLDSIPDLEDFERLVDEGQE